MLVYDFSCINSDGKMWRQIKTWNEKPTNRHWTTVSLKCCMMETSTEIFCGLLDLWVDWLGPVRSLTGGPAASVGTWEGLISNIWAVDVKQLQSTALAFSRDQSGIAESLSSAQQADPASSANQITCSAGRVDTSRDARARYLHFKIIK